MTTLELRNLIRLTTGEYDFIIPTTNSFNPSNLVAFLQLEEIYIICDCTDGPIEVNLPSIAQFDNRQNTKIYFLLKNPGSVIVKATAGNKIGNDTSITLTDENETCYLHIVDDNVWMNLSSSGKITQFYKYAELPTTNVTQYPSNPLALGEVATGGAPIERTPFAYDFLENGNLCLIRGCMFNYTDGTMVFEAYDLETEEPINGYWIAFRPNAQNKNKLDKIDELKMTAQFWDYWYYWTYSTESVPFEVQLVFATLPDTNLVAESFITKVKLVNDVLVATDLHIQFGGQTFGQIYQSETGIDPDVPGALLSYDVPYYTGDNNYYGMMNGPKAGFLYYGYQDTTNPFTFDLYEYIIGLNILTGQKVYLKPINALSLVTNLNPVIIDNKSFTRFTAHPKGCLFTIWDQDSINIDDGNNTIGVTALWSPMWNDPTKCVFITNRSHTNLSYLSTQGSIKFQNGVGQQLFSTNYCYIYSYTNNGLTDIKSFILIRYRLDSTQAPDNYIYPLTENNNDIEYYELNNLAFISNINLFTAPKPMFSFNSYYILQEEDIKIKKIQLNVYYPTNFYGNKIAGTENQLSDNYFFVAYTWDEYKTINIK